MTWNDILVAVAVAAAGALVMGLMFALIMWLIKVLDL